MGKTLIHRLTCLCLGITVASAAFVLPARAAGGDPADFIRALASEAVAVLSDDRLDPAGRSHAFRLLLRRGFDLPAVSRFVLGRHWHRANAGEREDFTQLFEDYVVATYGRRLGQQSRQVLTVNGQRADGVNGAIVHSQIVPDNGPAVKLDWRLKLREKGWRVVDIMVEGVSLAIAQRSEFSSVIRMNGGQVAVLLAKLRQKTQTLALRQNTTAVRTQ